ncbi:glycosyltransferase family 39 protein [Candidatus Poribacteria bacterium]|nr:glycosyltransferase family 39 protein [Candidatus Poribacteria bacterium]
MRDRRRILVALGALGITIIAFLPRGLSPGAYWTPDEILWIRRSLRFASAISRRDLKETVQSFHPGVITTWIGALSLYPKYRHVLFMFEGGRSPLPLDSQENLQRVRTGMAVATTALILSFFFLLRSLTNLKIALTAGFFFALDPWYLMESRRLHTDALAAGFMILSLLALLIHWEKRKWVYLLISGACLGLSCITRVTSTTLIIYFPFGFILHRMLCRPGGVFDRRDLSEFIWSFLSWLSVAILTSVALWPALWVSSVKIGSIRLPITPIFILAALAVVVEGYRLMGNRSIERRDWVFSLIPVFGVCLALPFMFVEIAIVFRRMKWALTTPHEVPQIFLGKVVYDPGLLYYPVMITIYSTPVVLFLAAVGFPLVWWAKRYRGKELNFRIYLCSAVFIPIYIISISLAAKKLSRYALPSAPVLDIMATISLWVIVDETIRFIKAGVLSYKYKMGGLKIVGLTISLMALLGLIVCQFLTVVMLHPYYSSYYNPLWGAKRVVRVTTMGRGEGLDKAASYLNRKKNAHQLIVRVSPLAALFFRRYFRGETLSLKGETSSQFVDYDVIYIRDLQVAKELGLDEEFYRSRTPDYTVRINGVEFVKIYKLKGGSESERSPSRLDSSD